MDKSSHVSPTGEVRILTWGKEKISVSSDGFIKENKKEWKRPTKPDPKKNNHVYTWLPFDRNGERKDCLLYTSPSPRDGLLSRMPSSA